VDAANDSLQLLASANSQRTDLPRVHPSPNGSRIKSSTRVILGLRRIICQPHESWGVPGANGRIACFLGKSASFLRAHSVQAH